MICELCRKSLMKYEDVSGQQILKNDLPTYPVFSISTFIHGGLGLIPKPANQTHLLPAGKTPRQFSSSNWIVRCPILANFLKRK